MKQFVRDTLVPASGYICWKPLDEERAKDLAAEMKRLNQQLREERERDKALRGLQLSAQTQKAPVKLPLEVICLVELTETFVDDETPDAFDFIRETRLKVKIKGTLNFPPDAVPKSQDPAAKTKGQTDPLDKRWFLNISVKVSLERAHEDVPPEDQDDAEAADNVVGTKELKVKCYHIDITKEVQDPDGDWQGDPMVESWLPREEVLRDIEEILQGMLRRQNRTFESKDAKRAVDLNYPLGE